MECCDDFQEEDVRLLLGERMLVLLEEYVGDCDAECGRNSLRRGLRLSVFERDREIEKISDADRLTDREADPCSE